MKFLKKILIAVVVLVLIWVMLAFFGPKTIHVERTLAMNTDAMNAFDQINTLKNWKVWSYWDNIDKKTMKDEWEGPASGVGAKHKWESANDSVGKGTLTITKSEPGKFVETSLELVGMGTHIGGWKIADSSGTVKVTSYMDMNVPFIMRPMMLFMNMDKMLGPDFEKSLRNLKSLCENMPKAPKFDIKENMMSETNILSIRETIKSVNEIGPTLGKLYAEIGKQMKISKVEMAGPVFAIYHHFSKDTIDMEAGVPVSAKVEKTSGRVKAGVLKAGNTAVLDYYGPYEKMQPAYDALKDWAKQNNKKLGNAPWEIYVTDPGVEKDTAKWLTKVVYYVE